MTCTGVLISPLPDLLPDVCCFMVRIFRLVLVLFIRGIFKKFPHFYIFARNV